jgi:hypothetical protein
VPCPAAPPPSNRYGIVISAQSWPFPQLLQIQNNVPLAGVELALLWHLDSPRAFHVTDSSCVRIPSHSIERRASRIDQVFGSNNLDLGDTIGGIERSEVVTRVLVNQGAKIASCRNRGRFRTIIDRIHQSQKQQGLRQRSDIPFRGQHSAFPHAAMRCVVCHSGVF